MLIEFLLWLLTIYIGIGLAFSDGDNRLRNFCSVATLLGAFAFFVYGIWYSVFEPLTYTVNVVFPYMREHWLLSLGVVAAWIGAGIVVAVLRWVDFYTDVKEVLLETRVLYDAMIAKIEGDEDAIAKKAKELLDRRDTELRSKLMAESGSYSYPPQISEHKAEFTAWALYWPFVALWLFLRNPVRKFYAWVYTKISGTLQAMVNRSFASLDLKL